MGRMLVMGLGPLALGLLFLALLGGVQGEASDSVPKRLNVTAQQLRNSKPVQDFCDRKIQECSGEARSEQLCLWRALNVLFREVNITSENVARRPNVTSNELCTFMSGPPTVEVEDTDALYTVIPVVGVLLVIMGLIGIGLHSYAKRDLLGFQSSGGGETIKNDGTDV